MKTKSHTKDKYNVITLGCSKNLVDSEVLVSQLKYNDFDVEHQSEKKDANIIIVIPVVLSTEPKRNRSTLFYLTQNKKKKERLINYMLPVVCRNAIKTI